MRRHETTPANRALAHALDQYVKARSPAEEIALAGARGTSALSGWFLGPKAENEELLKELALQAIAIHCQARHAYFPADPPFVTDEIRRTPAYLETVAVFKSRYAILLQRLKQSIPFFSYRNQGYMAWDVTLPALVGYLAALLYNQNNVAVVGAPVTTVLEMAVCDDICRMLGFAAPLEGDGNSIRPWGHITCDGSVANFEAIWSARNLKFWPLSLIAALKDINGLLHTACNFTVPLPTGGEAKLVELDPWTALNLKVDDILSLSTRLVQEYGVDPATLDAVAGQYGVQEMGLVAFKEAFLPDVSTPVILAPSSSHFSWPKGAAAAGLGAGALVDVPVDLDGRLDVEQLHIKLAECLAQKRPVMMTLVVLGSTEESAVDPLADVLRLRAEYRRQGLEFLIHVDAAWGGYFAAMLRAPVDGAPPDPDPTLFMSAHAMAQYLVLGEADSITVDSHKAGYVPFPAGGLFYRNSALRDLVGFTAPEGYRGGVDPAVTLYGLEGSRPGAAAASIYFSHWIIRPDQSGYGKILGQCMFNSKRLYAALVTMARPEDPFFVVPFQRLPAERAGQGAEQIAEQLELIRTRIVPKSNDELLADSEAMTLLKELGSDQVILAYAFGLKAQGGAKTDIGLLNQLNGAIVRRLSPDPEKEITQIPLFVASSTFDVRAYGRPFIDECRRRLRADGDPETPIAILFSTVMDPWLTETAAGNFIPTLIAELRQIVNEEVANLRLEPPAPPGNTG